MKSVKGYETIRVKNNTLQNSDVFTYLKFVKMLPINLPWFLSIFRHRFSIVTTVARNTIEHSEWIYIEVKTKHLSTIILAAWIFSHPIW